MPRKPLKPCRYPGCPNLSEEAYCPIHRKKVAKDYNIHIRPEDPNKRYGWKWKKRRDRYAQAHPLCEECLKQGRLTPMEEVHHILPIDRGGTDDESNLMSLCHSCHEKIHVALGDRKYKPEG
ncbi:MAG: HNH endonuclease [Bacilli bacterium]|nr:HNH endonuclease [Bacilli bacterium]